MYEITGHNPLALRTQRDVVDLGISFSNLAVTKTVNYELDKLKKEQAFDSAAERKRHAEALERQNREMQERIAELQRQNQRIQDARDRRRWCSGKTPYGTCDNQYCSNKLKRWAVTWRQCSTPLAWHSRR